MAKDESLKPTFIVLVGLPMCGKSTWTAQNIKEGDVILSLDGIMEEAGQTFHGIVNDYEKCYRTVDVKLIKQIYNDRFDLAIKERKNVIVDKTNLTVKTRRRLLARVPRDYRRIAVVFNWDMAVLEERNKQRKIAHNKYIPESVIKSMSDQYVAVSSDEGFNKIITVN